MRLLLAVKGDSPPAADILTAVSQAAAAGLGYLVAAHRTFVTGYLDNLNNIGVFLVSAHSYFNALA